MPALRLPFSTAAPGFVSRIEHQQFALLAQQGRSSTYAGAAVIAMTLVLARHLENSRLLTAIALIRLALFIHDSMLARGLQQELAQGEPSRRTVWRIIAAAGFANLTWGALTWPLAIGTSIDFLCFMTVIIALFSICLSMVSASFHPHTLAASTLGGCLGLAPKIFELTASVGLLLPLGFLIYFVTIYYFAQVLCRQARGGIVLDLRRKRIARQLAQTNAALQQALHHANSLADQDSLTKLRNRRAFEQALPAFVAACPDQQHWLLLIDVDHFKRINDRFGHAMGDGVLVALGTTLAQWEVEADGRLTGRWGGEEFIVAVAVQPHEDPGQIADPLRERIFELAECLHWPGTVELSASIGCARLDDPRQFDETLSRADAALYRAKNSGRNCWKLAA